MSNERNTSESIPNGSAELEVLQAEASVPGAAEAAGASEKLDAIEDIDFLLEELENKIAPLALA